MEVNDHGKQIHVQVFQITLRKGYSIPDLKIDMANLYQKTGLKNLATTFLMSDAQVGAKH